MDIKSIFESTRKHCTKGLIYKVQKSIWHDHGNVVNERIQMRLLRKKSCKCQQCSGLFEGFQESLANAGISSIKNWDSLEANKEYKLKCNIISTDFETGYADDWEYEMVEIQD